MHGEIHCYKRKKNIATISVPSNKNKVGQWVNSYGPQASAPIPWKLCSQSQTHVSLASLHVKHSTITWVHTKHNKHQSTGYCTDQTSFQATSQIWTWSTTHIPAPKSAPVLESARPNVTCYKRPIYITSITLKTLFFKADVGKKGQVPEHKLRAYIQALRYRNIIVSCKNKLQQSIQHRDTYTPAIIQADRTSNKL